MLKRKQYHSVVFVLHPRNYDESISVVEAVTVAASGKGKCVVRLLERSCYGNWLVSGGVKVKGKRGVRGSERESCESTVAKNELPLLTSTAS